LLAWARGAVADALRQRRTTALSAAAVGLGVSLCLGFGFLRVERFVATQEAATRQAETANAALQDELARLRDRLGSADQALGQTQRRIASLSDAASRQQVASEQAVTSRADRVAQLGHALEDAQRELHLTEAQRVTLMARLSKAETDLAAGQARRQQADAGVDEWQRKIEALSAERDRAAAERDQLRARVGQLEQQLAIRTRQPASSVAAAPTAPAVAAAPQAARAAAPAVTAAAPATARGAPRVAVATGRVVQFERVLASAGVDVEHLFADFGVKRGLGGPFVPMPRDGMPAGQLDAAKLAALAGLAKTLPVSAPMSGYRETSPFGERTDPFNGRRAFHPGIDLAAPYGTPVYATAPGVVTYAGYRGDYGKIVEINHGHGIVTRYGHLARYVVLVGEHVQAGTQIGYEGSTGRSTGPHVIYEIDVNGEPQDPEKFLELARLVPVAAR
jgi:murein DD-endopeptidase MepM/ murein hydrolase activator NlpD